MSAKLLVGRSVLPHVPLNSVSPENNSFSFSQYKHVPPFVCPGVCITLNSMFPICIRSPSSTLESASSVISSIPI